jgi:hypothetical protein
MALILLKRIIEPSSLQTLRLDGEKATGKTERTIRDL